MCPKKRQILELFKLKRFEEQRLESDIFHKNFNFSLKHSKEKKFLLRKTGCISSNIVSAIKTLWLKTVDREDMSFLLCQFSISFFFLNFLKIAECFTFMLILQFIFFSFSFRLSLSDSGQ